MKLAFAIAALSLGVTASSFATTYPTDILGPRIDYLDSWNPSVTAVPIDTWPGQAAPKFDTFGERDEAVEIEGLRVEIRGFRQGRSWTDFHARLATDDFHGHYLALYRSNQRVAAWTLNPFGNSYRDSFSTKRFGRGTPRTTLLEASADEDSALRLTLRTQIAIDSKQGAFHQFALVFRPDGAEYRLSHVEESIDIRYDAASGVVSGAGESRVSGPDGFILERREIRADSKGMHGCGRGDLARRLAKRLANEEDLRRLECLRERGTVLSRRHDRRPTELYDVAAR